MAIAMRVVVAGGAGLVGSHVVDQLVEGGHHVVVVDDLDPAAHDGVPAGLSPTVEYRWADLRDPGAWVDVEQLEPQLRNLIEQLAEQ